MPNVLVAEDDALVRGLLAECLERGGYAVARAARGGEAIRLIVEHRDLDLVVTDYRMPVADGLDVITAARDPWPPFAHRSAPDGSKRSTLAVRPSNSGARWRALSGPVEPTTPTPLREPYTGGLTEAKPATPTEREADQFRSWGIDRTYCDAAGVWRTSPAMTVDAIATAMGVRPDAAPPTAAHRFVREGTSPPLATRQDVLTEDGQTIPNVTRIPRGLPIGYHQLRDPVTGTASALIVAPLRCPLPAGLKTWGWSTQLYATRSTRSWGMGDLGDLAELGAWAKELGAGMMLVNPLHAPLPTLPQQTSPYYPSSRVYRNPLYLRIEDVPGAATLGPELDRLATAGRALNADPLVDRDAVFRLKMAALERLWAEQRERPGFADYIAAEGPDLMLYATFCVLCEQYGPGWQRWPAELRHPGSTAVADAMVRFEDRTRFHAWLQWLLDMQLRTAALVLPTMHDLAVGVDPGGADAWVYQDSIAPGFSVGCPPDLLNSLGQGWGFPPFDPWKLRAGMYRPYIAMIRAALRAGGGLRVDHVMGLFRLFWIPHGEGPAAGAYVRYASGELLDLLALEATRSGALVAGEDLGTVEPAVRRELALRHVMTYRLMWFEDRPPARYPNQALAAITTHDLPTIAGQWSGRDLKEQIELGTEPSLVANDRVTGRLRRRAGVTAASPAEEVVAACYAALAEAPSTLLCASLDDMLCVEPRVNLPGTMDVHRPNWRIALPVPIDQFRDVALAKRIATSLGRTGSQPAPEAVNGSSPE